MSLFSGGDDLQTVTDEIYGASEIPDSGRVVARPTPINTIWADVKQPRRAIPISIRMHWDGNPAGLIALFKQWHQVAEDAAGVPIDIEALLNKGTLSDDEGNLIDTDKLPSIAQGFIELIALAIDIKAIDLTNPISIVESDGRLLIETGERRWLAHHLLHIYLKDDKWSKIRAFKNDGRNFILRQASENTKRRDLNAISMARQLGLLIIDVRQRDGVIYQEYDDIVTAGMCERRYYAQVWDGLRHSVKGHAEQIRDAMGNLSTETMSRYRALLRLTEDEAVNDALWIKADVENWAEGALRDVATLPIGKVAQVVSRANWTIDDLKALKEAPVSNPYPTTAERFQQPQQPPATTEWMHKTILTKAGFYGVVRAVNGSLITAEMEPDGKRAQFRVEDVTLVAADAQRRPPVTPAPQPTPTFDVGDKVKTRLGTVGTVKSVNGRDILVDTQQRGLMRQNIENLTLVAKYVPTTPSTRIERRFDIGDKVKTTSGITGCTVIGYQGDLVYVERPSGTRFTIAEAQLSPDSVPQIGEEDIEPDVESETKPHEREWSEGVSFGDNHLLDTDKADSLPQYPFDIFQFNSTEAAILGAFSDIAEVTGEDQAALALDWVMEIKDLDAKALHEQGQLKPKLDEVYQLMSDTMGRWLQVTFANILQQVENAAVN
jgi:preprotein translocase subunit YajC